MGSKLGMYWVIQGIYLVCSVSYVVLGFLYSILCSVMYV